MAQIYLGYYGDEHTASVSDVVVMSKRVTHAMSSLLGTIHPRYLDHIHPKTLIHAYNTTPDTPQALHRTRYCNIGEEDECIASTRGI